MREWSGKVAVVGLTGFDTLLAGGQGAWDLNNTLGIKKMV